MENGSAEGCFEGRKIGISGDGSAKTLRMTGVLRGLFQPQFQKNRVIRHERSKIHVFFIVF